MSDTKPREIEHVSASAIKTFLLCTRKFWFAYVLRHRTPATPAMLHGTRVHEDIEHYLRGKKSALTTVEAGEAQARGFVPESGAIEPGHVELDASRIGVTVAGLPVKGYLDVVDPRGITVDGDHIPIHVIDWKVRSRFTYAPGRDELLDDLQAKLYAAICFHAFSDVDRIAFSHVNMIRVDHKYGRNTPKSERRTCVFEREAVESWFGGPLVSIVAEMKAVGRKRRANDVKPEKGSKTCYKYGECQYKKNPIGLLRGRTCYDIEYRPNGTPTTSNNTEEPKMALDLQKLLAKKKDKKTEPAAPEADTPDEKPSETAPSGLEAAKKAYIDGDRPADFSVKGFDLTHADLRAFVKFKEQIDKDTQAAAVESDVPNVNPPDAAPDIEPKDLADLVVGDFDFTSVSGIGPSSDTAIREYIVDEGIERLVDLLDRDLKKISGVGKVSEEALKLAISQCRIWAPGQEDLLILAKKALDAGIQSKADFYIGKLDEEHAAMLPDSPPENKDAPDTTDVPPTKTGAYTAERGDVSDRSRTLYIDCQPVKGDSGARLAEEVLAPYKKTIAREEGVTYWCADRYGNARKLLADMVIGDPDPVVSTSLIVRSADEGMDQLLPEIIPLFDLVVRG